MKKHFAFINIPAAGHINPTAPLVEELLRRGHRISYACKREAVAPIEEAGARIVDLPFEMPPVPAAAKGFTAESMGTMFRFLLDNTRRCLPLLIEHFQQDRPDVVCFDMMTFMGRMLADKLGVPQVALHPSFSSNEKFSLREKMLPADIDMSPFADFGRQVQELATEHGLELAPGFMGDEGVAELNLSFVPRTFQLEADTFDDRFHFLGPMLGQRAEQEWQPRDPDSPLLFISLGTAFNQRPEFYRMCFEAFGDSPWHVAMSIGGNVEPAEIGPVPDNFDVRESFPQLAVLRKATAFLSHTGMNSTMESLYYGVPLVAVPQMPEQGLNADRVQELGLGRRLETEEVTTEQLRTTVDEVAHDAGIRARLAEMQSELRECGGAVAGADALEAYLA